MTSGGWQRTTPARERSSWAWQQARAAALDRDGYRCRAIGHWTPTSPTLPIAGPGPRCTAWTNTVDHINPNDDHTPTNLASLCSQHHNIKTQREAAHARWQHRMRRAPEPHPGLLP